MNWKKRAALWFAMYALDVAISMLGFILAFGLTVKSWTALIALPLVTRFVMHVVTTAIMRADAERAAQGEKS